MAGRPKKTTEEFVREALSRYGDHYDYSQTVYETARIKVKILCRVHGPFFKSPGHHLDGQGCPACVARHKDSTKQKMSATWKSKFANGYAPRKMSDAGRERIAEAQRNVLPEERLLRAAKAGKTMTGRPQSMEKLTGKHSWNVHGKWWHFINRELGAELKGRNLNQLIRDNTHLFDSRHLVWGKSGCTAAISLRQLAFKGTKKTRTLGSWFNWVLGDQHGRVETKTKGELPMDERESLGAVGALMNELVQDRLTIKGTTKIILDAPKNALRMRVDVDAGLVFIAANQFEQYLGDRVGELIEHGIAVKVFVSLGAGTVFEGPPTQCYQIAMDWWTRAPHVDL